MTVELACVNIRWSNNKIVVKKSKVRVILFVHRDMTSWRIW